MKTYGAPARRASPIAIKNRSLNLCKLLITKYDREIRPVTKKVIRNRLKKGAKKKFKPWKNIAVR